MDGGKDEKLLATKAEDEEVFVAETTLPSSVQSMNQHNTTDEDKQLEHAWQLQCKNLHVSYSVC